MRAIDSTEGAHDIDLSLLLLLIRFTAGLLLMGLGAQKLIGIALAIGFFTPLAAALIVGQLFVAIVKAHWATGLWVRVGGYEFTMRPSSSPSRSASAGRAATRWTPPWSGTR